MILNGNALHIPLADQSVQCAITSPPYWGLRDYGIGGQLGLEPTPEEYVANMVAVFREVWRVLRDDGTCWLNLGDSYASQTKGSGGPTPKQASNTGSFYDVRHLDHGLKDKDLCGIPWRVAFALQQPYYSGVIRNEADRIWLAAMIDGEGCMYIHKRKVGQNNGQGYTRKHDSYGAGLEVANTHLSIIERCQQITGKGSICHQDKESRMKNRNQRLYRWTLRSNECRDIIREVYPYLVGKKHEARLVLGCPSSGEQAQRAHAGVIALHNGFEVDIDFKEPASMYEPGWYLRSDCIWSKLNPMPESVTDRPTKAHEYVFLLTKQARYFYDADAVREPGSDSTVERWGTSTPQRKNASPQGLIAGSVSGESCMGINPAGRNRRTVWNIATQPYSGAHFATFPEALVEPCLLAGTSERGCCPVCGKAWKRVVEKEKPPASVYTGKVKPDSIAAVSHPDLGKAGMGQKLQDWYEEHPPTTTGWLPACEHDAPPSPCVVFDPFSGSGTVGVVAQRHGRRFVGLELSMPYIKLAQERIAKANGYHVGRLL